MAGVILSLSGCGGGGNSGKFHSMSTETNNDISSSSYEVKQVAVISSPALQKDGYYRIYSGATLSGMDNAQYYVANIGNETQQATLNLGFSYQPDPNASLVVVNDRTKGVVFAYDPSGTANKWKNGGNVTFTNGRLLRYRSLKLNEQSYNTVSIDAALSTESFDVHDEDIIHLVFSDDNVKYPNPDYDPEYELEYDEEYDDDDNLISRIPNNQEDYDYYTRELLDIVSYDYVWHADPDHKDEYYTVGLDDTTEYTWDSLSASYEDYGYIAHDIKYTDSSLNFIENQTATKDDEQEYVVYYSDDIASAVAEEKGEGFEGPYIFATLPIVQGSTLAEVKALMTHTPEEAYNCPVFHIEDDGVYSLSGTWNGQIRVGDNVSAVLILNGLTVNCPVGPAIVIEGYEESYYTDEVDVNVNSIGLSEGDVKTADIYFITNDPENPVVIVPLTLTVGPEGVAESNVDAFEVYPNPATSMVTVKGDNLSSLAIYNVAGQLVRIVKLDSMINNIDMNVEAGVYFFSIYDNNGNSSVQRIVITK